MFTWASRSKLMHCADGFCLLYVKAETAPAKLQPSSQTSAAGSQWEAEELQRQQQELDKRAAELDRREQQMQFEGGFLLKLVCLYLHYILWDFCLCNKNCISYVK